jgi:serine/threonine protein kinase
LSNGILKIADFGISKRKGQFTTSLSTGGVGTFNFMAPGKIDIFNLLYSNSNHIKSLCAEVMNNQPYTEKADVWSFGMVLYELTTKRIPYDYCQDESGDINVPFLINEVCHNKKTPPLPEGIEIDPTLLNLMKQCWNWDAKQRPSFTEIVQTLRNLDLKSSLYYMPYELNFPPSEVLYQAPNTSETNPVPSLGILIVRFWICFVLSRLKSNKSKSFQFV